MITVKEFCEKYNVHCSGVYAKLQRQKSKLQNHIFKISGKIVFDDFAENALLPKHKNSKVQETANAYSEIEYRLQRHIELAEDKIREQDKIINELNEQIKKIENEKNALITENENLKKQISENGKKPKIKFLQNERR